MLYAISCLAYKNCPPTPFNIPKDRLSRKLFVFLQKTHFFQLCLREKGAKQEAKRFVEPQLSTLPN
jgi:hypothetical protein